MAGLLDWQTEEDRIAQQRALQAYSNQVGQQQARQEVWDALGQTLPAQIVKSIYQAARLPGDVYQGKVDPRSDEAISRAADFAGGVMLGGFPLGAAVGREAAAQGGMALGIVPVQKVGGLLAQPTKNQAATTKVNFDDHSSLIAKALEDQFKVPVNISRSKTDWGESHYITPNFPSNTSDKPFVVRVSDHPANSENRWYRNEYQVNLDQNNSFDSYIKGLLAAAEEHGQSVGFLPKKQFVPFEGEVIHRKYGKGKVLKSDENVTVVDFGGEIGIKKISSAFFKTKEP